MKTADEYPDEQKIDFFNANWEYIDRILEVVQSGKLGEVKAGTYLLEWLAEYLERKVV